jgi:GNAT superfamily N-acetyltransferase
VTVVTRAATASPLLGPPGQAYEAARLRWAALRDAERLAALWHDARPEPEAPAETMRAWLEHGGALMLEDEGGALLSALRWRDAARGWEVDVATHPQHRGQGYGRWLLTKVEAAAIRANVPLLTLALPIDAPAAQLAYFARIGYLEQRRSPEGLELHKRVGGTWQTKRPGTNGAAARPG